jgi:hypothetical protein
MKRSARFAFPVILVALLLLLAVAGSGQDPVKVAPANFKVLFENDRVRVLEYQSKAGEKISLHSHPANVVYGLTPGSTKFTLPDGTTKTTTFKAGEVVWSDGGPHSQETITATHVIQVELKEPKAATPAAK